MKAQLQIDRPFLARGTRTSPIGGAEGFVGVSGLGLNAREPEVPGVAGGVAGSSVFGVLGGDAAESFELILRIGDNQSLPGVSGEERLEPLPKRGVSGDAASSSGVVNSSLGM